MSEYSLEQFDEAVIGSCELAASLPYCGGPLQCPASEQIKKLGDLLLISSLSLDREEQ